ncbi:MAG: phosphoribosyltransferase family protein, partial [Patescibacteria group bacterium]
MLQVTNEQELVVVRQTFPEAEELFSRQRIAEHVTSVARIIAQERKAGGSPRPLKLVVVLDGAMPYGMDLGGELAAAGVSDLSIDTIQLSRYGDDTEPSQTPAIIKDLRYPITGEDVLVVEDILDGGLTLAYLKETILLP